MAGVGPYVPEVEAKNPKQMATTQRESQSRSKGIERSNGGGRMRSGRLIQIEVQNTNVSRAPPLEVTKHKGSCFPWRELGPSNSSIPSGPSLLLFFSFDLELSTSDCVLSVKALKEGLDIGKDKYMVVSASKAMQSVHGLFPHQLPSLSLIPSTSISSMHSKVFALVLTMYSVSSSKFLFLLPFSIPYSSISDPFHLSPNKVSNR